MADSDNLTALKKAYAETILNTAKEAAARVLISEKRAQRSQRELFALKEESIRLMLVLKRMLDHKVYNVNALDRKVNESAMLSMIQQKRIEELEAQLGEAEDIVKDLRTELGELHDEYAKATNKLRVLKEQNFTILPDNNRIYNQMSNLTYYVDPCSCRENCGACISDFPSILTRRKGTELYRNGCTQRINALQRSLFKRDLCVSDKKDDINDLSSLVEDNQRREKCHLSKTSPYAAAAENFKIVGQESVDTIQTDEQQNTEKVKDPVFIKACTNGVLSVSDKTDDDLSFVKKENQNRHKCQLSETSLNVEIGEDAKLVDQESVHTKTEEVKNLAVPKVCTSQKNDDLSSNKVEPGREQDRSNADLNAADLHSVEVVAIKPVNNPIIKYTFQRKRKRELLSSPDRDVLINEISLKEKVDKNNVLTSESSSQSRPLAQKAPDNSSVV